MIEPHLIGAGVVIGIAVAAPIGPINLMAIRNALTGGFWSGLFTGTGAVLGDGTFAVVAAFGLTAVSAWVLAYAAWIQAIGGAALIAVGLRTIFVQADTVPDAAAPPRERRRGRALTLVATTYLLTITNPATMMGFIAIFSGVGGLVARPGDYAAAASMVAAVMAGSLIWWIVISGLATLMQARMAGGWLRYVNWGSGAVIALFGVAVLARLVWAAV